MIDSELLLSLGWSQTLIDEVNRTAALVKQSEIVGVGPSEPGFVASSVHLPFLIAAPEAVGSSELRVDSLPLG